eukprot:2158800-Rhodomonas_salina.1
MASGERPQRGGAETDPSTRQPSRAAGGHGAEEQAQRPRQKRAAEDSPQKDEAQPSQTTEPDSQQRLERPEQARPDAETRPDEEVGEQRDGKGERGEEDRTAGDENRGGAPQNLRDKQMEFVPETDDEVQDGENTFKKSFERECVSLTTGNILCIWVPSGDLYRSVYPQELATGISVLDMQSVRAQEQTKQTTDDIRSALMGLAEHAGWTYANANDNMIWGPTMAAVETGMSHWGISPPVTQEQDTIDHVPSKYIRAAVVTKRWMPPPNDNGEQFWSCPTKERMEERDIRFIPRALGITMEDMQHELTLIDSWVGTHVVKDSLGIS